MARLLTHLKPEMCGHLGGQAGHEFSYFSIAYYLNWVKKSEGKYKGHGFNNNKQAGKDTKQDCLHCW